MKLYFSSFVAATELFTYVYSVVGFEQSRYEVGEDSDFLLLCLDISDLQSSRSVALSTVAATARGKLFMSV